MDLSSAIEAKSDQKNADDFLAGPKTFQIERVEVRGGQDQPVWIHLVGEQGKPWKPSKSMTRVLVQAWGPDGDTYAGRFVTLFRDPEIKWAGEAVGGISVAALSHIDKTFSMKLTVSRGKRKAITVQKLEAPAQTDWLTAAETVTDMDSLRALYMDAQAAGASPDVLKTIQGHTGRIERINH